MVSQIIEECDWNVEDARGKIRALYDVSDLMHGWREVAFLNFSFAQGAKMLVCLLQLTTK